jgi:hypothetical protein
MKKNNQRQIGGRTFAVLIVTILLVSGCGKGSKSGGTTAGNAGLVPATLTITGLPDGSFGAYVIGTGIDLSTFDKINSAEKSVEAIGTQTSPGANAFTMTEGMGLWSKTGKRQVLLVNQGASMENLLDKNNPVYRTATANFSMGRATVNYSSFKAVTK